MPGSRAPFLVTVLCHKKLTCIAWRPSKPSVWPNPPALAGLAPAPASLRMRRPSVLVHSPPHDPQELSSPYKAHSTCRRSRRCHRMPASRSSGAARTLPQMPPPLPPPLLLPSPLLGGSCGSREALGSLLPPLSGTHGLQQAAALLPSGARAAAVRPPPPPPLPPPLPPPWWLLWWLWLSTPCPWLLAPLAPPWWPLLACSAPWPCS